MTMKNIKCFHPATLYLLAIACGIASGLSDVAVLHQIGSTLSAVFIKIFRCISLPIIALSIIVTIARVDSEKAMHRLWQRTLFYTLSTTIIAAVMSCLLYLAIHPQNVNLLDAAAMPDTKKIHYWEYLTTLIPANIFEPFLTHQVVGVLFVGIVLGVAIRFIPDAEARKTVNYFFNGIHAIFLTITRWVVAIIPLGLFGFIAVTVVQLRQGTEIRGLGEYLLVVVLANAIQGFFILPLWLKSRGIAPFHMMRKMMPALSIAFFSKSSAGALPITMQTIENQLGVSSRVSRFVLPLCTSINMNGCAAFIFTTVIYLMQNHGVSITMGTMALWIVIATIAAVGNAGVPMGCFFLSASLLASMDIPITLLGVILPFYGVIDMIETALNVWSDSCVAKMVEQDTA